MMAFYLAPFVVLLIGTVMVAVLMKYVRSSALVTARGPAARYDRVSPEAARAVETALWHWERSRRIGDAQCDKAFAWLTEAVRLAPYHAVRLYAAAHSDHAFLCWCAYDSPDVEDFCPPGAVQLF